MKKLSFLISFVGLSLLLFFEGAFALECKTAAECAELFPKVAISEILKKDNFTEKEIELAQKMQQFNGEAIPFLISLLNHKKNEVRYLAWFTLDGTQGLNEKHLDSLIELDKKGNMWAGPFIGKIGGERATKYLTSDIKKHLPTHISPYWPSGFEALGSAGIPHLVNFFRCSSKCDKYFYKKIGEIFSKMGNKASSAIQPLLEIARNKKFHKVARRGAVSAIGSIGKSSQIVIPELKALAKENKDLFTSKKGYLFSVLDQAFINMKAPEATDLLLEYLKKNPYTWVIREIAELGEVGYSAGPTIIEYLKHDDLELREAAAQALGYIKYKPAEDALIETLKDKQNWRLVYASALALGELRSEKSMYALEEISKTYWLPPVRKVALEAFKKARFGKYLLEFNISENINVDIPACKQVEFAKVEEDKNTKIYDKEESGKLDSFSYKVKDLGSLIDRVPHVALKHGESWFVGSNWGEFVGELVFMEKGKEPLILLKGNIIDIFKMPYGIVALTARLHMTFNEGEVYKVFKNKNDKWEVEHMQALPGATSNAWKLEGDKILINTYERGSVILLPNGQLEMAKCVN